MNTAQMRACKPNPTETHRSDCEPHYDSALQQHLLRSSRSSNPHAPRVSLSPGIFQLWILCIDLTELSFLVHLPHVQRFERAARFV
ncbi:hypothetical protein L484_002675 [Morus notabilis]|uniref:Uncharacterized protein n=1 Tax=Morus notabilis TaxID=981085 RepID=W9RIF1_9ROSA|nr:hypothetical protein L484_002675 [Morus notabilis]